MKHVLFRSAAKKALCLLLLLSLLSTVFPLSAFAENASTASSVTHVGTYHYMSNEGKNIDTIYNEDRFLFNDGWFLTDGRVYNSHLATLSSVASVTSAGYYTENLSDFSQHDKNVREFLDEMRFEDIESNQYYHLESYQNSVSCIMGHKTVGSGENAKTLLVILPMSANYGQEWNGSFYVNESGLHSGFKAARDECLRFMKQYITKYHVTGDVKLWVTGHSRGAAIANLIGSFFALGCGDYFDGCDINVSPGDMYNYTFATPGTVTNHGVTTTDVLSVEGTRADYPNDTPGDEYVYADDDADAEVDPQSEQFSFIRNCRPSYDLITLTPPYQWDFTVFGSTFEITDGEKSTKKLMTSWLKKADIDVYNAFSTESTLFNLFSTGSNGDPDEYAWKRFEISTLSIVDDGNLTMSEMMAQRIEGLVALTQNREYYTEEYQDVFRAIFGIIGLADKELTENLDITSEIGTIMINYIAYACERMDNSDPEATAKVIVSLYSYLTGEEIDDQTVTVREMATKLAALINNSFVLKFLLAGALPENIKSAMCEVMGLETKDYITGFEKLLSDLCSKDETLSTAGFDTLCRIIIKLLEGRGDYSAVFDALGKTDEGVYTGTAKLVDAAAVALHVILKDEAGNVIPLKQKADELLTAMVEKLGDTTVESFKNKGYSDRIVEDLTSYFAAVANNPEKTRRIFFYMLSYTDGDQTIDFTKELRTMFTLITQFNKISLAHYNEVYIAWMRAQDTSYNISLGNADEDKAVSILDVTSIQRYCASVPEVILNEMAADVDRDNAITTLDATFIQRYLADLPCPDGIGKPMV